MSRGSLLPRRGNEGSGDESNSGSEKEKKKMKVALRLGTRKMGEKEKKTRRKEKRGAKKLVHLRNWGRRQAMKLCRQEIPCIKGAGKKFREKRGSSWGIGGGPSKRRDYSG